MARIVECIVLKSKGEGLDKQPFPGKTGKRIFDSVSKEGWKKWLEFATMLINENGLNTADPSSITFLEKNMLGFFFDEGEHGKQPPQGFSAAPKKK